MEVWLEIIMEKHKEILICSHNYAQLFEEWRFMYAESDIFKYVVGSSS